MNQIILYSFKNSNALSTFGFWNHIMFYILKIKQNQINRMIEKNSKNADRNQLISLFLMKNITTLKVEKKNRVTKAEQLLNILF